MAGARLGLDGRERGWIAGVDALGVTETTGAVPRAAIGIGRDVEDDVVGMRRIAGHAADSRQGTRGRHVVEPQSVAHAPGDIVIGAGSIAAYADAANDNVARGVESESSAEHINAANLLPNHRVGSGTVICRSPVSDAGIDRIAVLQSIQVAAGLHRRIEIGGGESQACRVARAVAAG